MRRDCAITFLLAAGAMILVYLAAGPTLGLFIGGFFVATFFLPIFVTRGIPPAGATALAISIVWLSGIFRGTESFGEWIALAILLATYIFFLAELGAVFARTGMGVELAGALVILLALAWLTWPIWLRAGHEANLLIRFHPPLVANGVLAREEPWTEKTEAYQLTDLDQDVPIQLPGTVLPCAGFCALTGLVLWRVSLLRRRGRHAKAVSPA